MAEATFTWERYRAGLIFGAEKLAVHMGPVCFRTSFGSYSHGYAIVPFRNISRQSERLWLLNSPEMGKKGCSERIHQPKPKERKFITMKI